MILHFRNLSLTSFCILIHPIYVHCFQRKKLWTQTSLTPRLLLLANAFLFSFSLVEDDLWLSLEWHRLSRKGLRFLKKNICKIRIVVYPKFQLRERQHDVHLYCMHLEVLQAVVNGFVVHGLLQLATWFDLWKILLICVEGKCSRFSVLCFVILLSESSSLSWICNEIHFTTFSLGGPFAGRKPLLWLLLVYGFVNKIKLGKCISL